MKAAGGPMAPATKRLPPAATWIGEGEAAVGGLGKTEKVTERGKVFVYEPLHAVACPSPRQTGIRPSDTFCRPNFFRHGKTCPNMVRPMPTPMKK